jgi:ankyrin repeat protein
MSPAFGFGQATTNDANNSNSNNNDAGIDASTPWTSAADGNLALLQASLTALQQTPGTLADEHGYTLLQAAASYSQMAVLTWLLEDAVVPVDAVDKEGDSALHYASTVEAAQRLVQAGISISLRNAQGHTALESKLAELQESLEDNEDDSDNEGMNDDEDEDVVQLKAVIEYLQSVSTSSVMAQ